MPIKPVSTSSKTQPQHKLSGKLGRFVSLNLTGGLRLKKPTVSSTNVTEIAENVSMETVETVESIIDLAKYDGPFGNVSDVSDIPEHKPIQPVHAQSDKTDTDHSPSHPSLGVAGLRSVALQRSDIYEEIDVLGSKTNPEPDNQPPLYNAVAITQEYLDDYTASIQTLSDELVDLLLNGEAKAILSLESASSYVQAFLRDGLSIDAEVDVDIMDVLFDIGRLDVIFKALKLAKFSPVYKAIFFKTFVRNMAEQSCASLMSKRQVANKNTQTLKRLRDLELLIKQRQDKIQKQNNPNHFAGDPSSSEPHSKSSLGAMRQRS